MKKEEKFKLVEDLAEKISAAGSFYITDISELSVNDTNVLRKAANKADVSLQVVKNKLVIKALEQINITDAQLMGSLVGPTSLMLADDVKAPINLIKKMRKTSNKPILKAAYIEESVYVGDDQIDTVSKLKSKNEIIGDIVGMLQSPANNVIGALQSPMSKIASILALEGEGSEETLKDFGNK